MFDTMARVRWPGRNLASAFDAHPPLHTSTNEENANKSNTADDKLPGHHSNPAANKLPVRCTLAFGSTTIVLDKDKKDVNKEMDGQQCQEWMILKQRQSHAIANCTCPNQPRTPPVPASGPRTHKFMFHQFVGSLMFSAHRPQPCFVSLVVR